MSKQIVSALCAFLLAICFVVSQAPAEATEQGAEAAGLLAIGVRSKAQPFSYKLQPGVINSDATRGPLSRAGYGGYMVRLCDAALAEMLIDPEISLRLKMQDIGIYDIDEGIWKTFDVDKGIWVEQPKAEAKPGDTQDNPVGTRFFDLGAKFDILCDPATITNERREFMVSPPVFLTGVGYLTLKGQGAPLNPCGKPKPPSEVKQPAETEKPAASATSDKATADTQSEPEFSPALIGIVGGTTAQDRGLQALIDAKELPQYEDKLITALRRDKPACGDGAILVKTYDSHEEAAKDFCAGGNFHYYVGDLEIIRTYASAVPGCKFDNGAITYTNDRYGIFGKALRGPGRSDKSDDKTAADATTTQKDNGRALLVADFFSILTRQVVFNPSILDKAYNDSFPGLPQSRKLKLFYWSIRGERMPDVIEPAEVPDKNKAATGSGQKAGSQDGAAMQDTAQ